MKKKKNIITHFNNVAPTINDDITLLYDEGQHWFNTVTKIEYLCKSNIEGAAVWEEVGSGGGSEGTITPDAILITKVYSDIEIAALPANTLFWDDVNQTYAYKLADGGTIQINQEPFDLYTNLEGTGIVEMDMVSVCGASGNRTAICLTDATDNTKSRNCIGMVTVLSIGNNNVGRITKNGGKVRGLNTNISGWVEGDTLWVDPLNKGKLTNIEPAAGYNKIMVGILSVKHSTNGVIELAINVIPKLSSLSDVDGVASEVLDTDSVLIKQASSGLFKTSLFSTLKTFFSTIFRLKTEIGDAHGFINPPNASNFTISVSAGGLVTINLLSNAGNYKINGTEYVNNGLTLANITPSLGQNSVCINSSGLVVTETDIMNLIKIPCLFFNWDGTAAILSDELHLSNRNLIQHKKEHETDGSRYVSGFATTFGTLATNTFSSALGVIRDEERYHSIGAKTNLTIMYRNAALTAMITEAASTAVQKLNGTVPRWDNNGVLTDVANGNYGVAFIYATNRKIGATSAGARTDVELVSVIGQAEYTSLAAAQAATHTLAGMSVAEWKLLYIHIGRRTGGGGGSYTFIQADDKRTVTTGLATSGSGLTSLPASSITVTASGNLGTNAQTSLENLDAVKVDKSLYDANSILIATADNTPIALTVGASTFVGRKASGDISALTASEARTVLNVADGATANAKASAAEIAAATDDTKYMTPKDFKDAGQVNIGDYITMTSNPTTKCLEINVNFPA